MTGPVVVQFDGAWAKPHPSEFWGYGYTLHGPGIDFEEGRASLGPHLMNRVMALIALFKPQAIEGEKSIRIHTVQVADLEGATAALIHLRDAGWSGEVLLHGDYKPLIRRLQSGEPFNRRAVDYELLEHHRQALNSLLSNFADIGWKWIHRSQNRRADELARRAIHEVIEHKIAQARAIQEHPERDPTGGLLAVLAPHLLPGEVHPERLMHIECPCGPCLVGRKKDAGLRQAQE